MVDSPPSRPAADPARRMPRRSLRLSSGPAIWTGVVVAAAGIVVIVLGWGQAAQVPHVAQQLPYVVSGGLFGLALVVVGLTIVDAGVRADLHADDEELLDEMAEAMRELSARVDELERVLADRRE